MKQQNNKNKSWSLQSKKIDEPLERLMKKKGKIQIINMGNERRDITTDPTEQLYMHIFDSLGKWTNLSKTKNYSNLLTQYEICNWNNLISIKVYFNCLLFTLWDP